MILVQILNTDESGFDWKSRKDRGMYKLCTAEKPSVAVEIARVFGAEKKEKGYFIGNGYIVTWAVGHLVGLAEPEAYGFMAQKDIYGSEENKKMAYDELPLIPKVFKKVILPNTVVQYEIVKTLMHREDVIEIIDCGDMGPEGHILQWLIREQAGCVKPVRRLCATSMTEEALRSAMLNLRPIEDFKKIIIGEYCKKRADWILGMSMSRCASIKYSARIDVGRVQSPTLYFIVKRYLDVKDFVPVEYYILEIEYAQGHKAYWRKDTEGIFPENVKDNQNRILVKQVLEDAVSTDPVETGIVHIEKVNKSINRPQLYDITELERDANITFGYPADRTLAIAQSLYEKHKILSYPRTDSRYITSDLEPYMYTRMKQIADIERYKNVASKVIEQGLNIDSRIVDDSKVTDHHALIATERIRDFNFSSLNEEEQNIFHLILTRMILALSPKYIFEETVVQIKAGRFTFTDKGCIPVKLGWKEAEKALLDKEESKENVLPQLLENQNIRIKTMNIVARQTEPPILHTEATLLSAMENAGATIDNGDILKGRGIGTQATRGAIIKSLFEKKYIKNEIKGRTPYLVPTQAGINVIKILPPELYSPKITSTWETNISEIVSGNMTETDFMAEFESFIHRNIAAIKSAPLKKLDFSPEKEIVGECPWCHTAIYKILHPNNEGKEIISLYCSEKTCGFSLNSDNLVFFCRTKRFMTAGQMLKLVSQGKIKAVCVNKNNRKYDGEFLLKKNEKGYAQIVFQFPLKQNK